MIADEDAATMVRASLRASAFHPRWANARLRAATPGQAFRPSLGERRAGCGGGAHGKKFAGFQNAE